MKHYSKWNIAAKILLIIAGICWGLIGVFDFELVGAIFGEMSALTRIIYVVFGLAALFKIALWFKKSRK